MTTGWNFVSGESWKEYIQRSSITNDLDSSHRESAKSMINAISSQTTNILTGFNSLGSSIDGVFDQLNSNLGSGFNMVADRMNAVAGEIGNMNSAFQWGFSNMITHMEGMNESLDRLIRIAKTPVQTWAYNQFEIARENFRKKLYDNALKRLEKAVNGDQTSAGYEEEWRFHNMIGVIRLGFYDCDIDLVDPEKAEKEFLLAARYAEIDEPKSAAKAYLSAGWSAYVQGKLPEALKYTKKAISVDKNLTEGFFQLAKFYMADNKPQEALPYLKQSINESTEYIIKAAGDGDFKAKENDLNDFFNSMKQEAISALEPKIRPHLENAIKWSEEVDEVSECRGIIESWDTLLDGNGGLLDILNYDDEDLGKDVSTVKSLYEKGIVRKKIEKAIKEERIAVENKIDKSRCVFDLENLKEEFSASFFENKEMINISKFYNKLGFSLDNDKGTSQQFFISTFGKISLESVFLENRKIIEKYNEKLKYLKKHERDLSRNGSELISIVLKEMSTVPNEDKTIKEIILSCCDDKYAFLNYI